MTGILATAPLVKGVISANGKSVSVGKRVQLWGYSDTVKKLAGISDTQKTLLGLAELEDKLAGIAGDEVKLNGSLLSKII